MIARFLSACAVLMAAAASPPPPPKTPCLMVLQDVSQPVKALADQMKGMGASIEMMCDKYLHSDNQKMADGGLENCFVTALQAPVTALHAFGIALGSAATCTADPDKSFAGCSSAIHDTANLLNPQTSAIMKSSTMQDIQSKWKSCSDKDLKKKISERIFQDFKRADQEIKYIAKGGNPLTKKTPADGEKLLMVMSFAGHILESLTTGLRDVEHNGPGCRNEMSDIGRILADIPRLGKKLQNQCDPSHNQKFIDEQKDTSEKFLAWMKKYQPEAYDSLTAHMGKQRLFDAFAGLFKNTAMASTAAVFLGGAAFISAVAFLAVAFRSRGTRQMSLVGREDLEVSEDVEVAVE